MEELVAEIGAAFLCADLRITPETRDDHAAYIASWLKVLKDDKRAIFPPPAMRRRPPTICTGLRPQEAQS
jgi:antirestriction protein ArdC